MAKKQTSSDWRDLKSTPKKRSHRKPISWRARFRAIWHWTKIIFAIAIIGTIIYGLYYTYQNFYFNDIFSSSGKPISRIELKTDGNISGAWINQYLKIKRGTTLSEVNIFELKQMLDMLSQIKTSKVERIFPDILRITISEHKVAAKIILPVDYQNRLYIISPNGFFFTPVCIDESEIDSLKFVEGLKPNFVGNTPAQYKQMPKLLDFINASKTRMPEEFEKWRAINVSQMESITLPLIVAKGKNSVEYIFKVGNYPRQFDRLEYILRYMKENPIESVEKIDLTLKEWSVVKFAKPKKNEQ